MATAALNEEAFELAPPATQRAIEANKPKTTIMRLLKNYRPAGDFEVVGWHKQPKTRKNPAGQLVVIEAGGFIADTDDTGKIMPAPPALAGTGYADKLLVDTVIRIGSAEAKVMKAAGIAEIDFED